MKRIGAVVVACGMMLLVVWLVSRETPVAAGTVPAKAVLQAGFAQRDITPEVGKDKPPVYMAGFGQNRIATGVQDPLFARAVVLSDGTNKIALVSLDIVGFFYPNALNVRNALPGYTHVVVSSTHNHEGPDTMGLWGPNPLKNGINLEYLKRVEQEAIAAVQAAEKNLADCTAKYGTVRAPELLIDSREPYILHDDLYALQFTKTDGKPLGILINWHCHPETLADKNTKISADYVGYCCEALEKSHGCPIAYFTGTVGGLMTSLRIKLRDEQGTLLPENSLELTKEYGKRLAQQADKALASAQAVTLTPLQAKKQVFYIPLANPLYKAGRTMGVLDRDAYRWQGDPVKVGDKMPPRVSTGDIAMQTEVSLLTLGEVQVACIPGEIYPETVKGGTPDPAEPGADFPDAPIEPTIFSGMSAKYKMLFGLANDEIGYFVPKRQWDVKAPFCYGRKKDQYGEENSCGPETTPIVCEMFRRLGK
ncbi:MAG: neutral/alkaline non-lysosomal ceramidase N-terminal domain-containing protein [Gemmatales bacterium]